MLLTQAAKAQTSAAGAPEAFSAFNAAEGNFYQTASIRPKGLFGKTFLSCSSMDGSKNL